MIYRVDARTLERIQALELIRDAAEAFLYALATDPGWPQRSQMTLQKAVDAVPKGGIETIEAVPASQCMSAGPKGEP